MYQVHILECLNTRKSEALAVGGWSTATKALDIAYYPEIMFLSVIFLSTVEQSMNKSWATMTRKFRAQVRDA